MKRIYSFSLSSSAVPSIALIHCIYPFSLAKMQQRRSGNVSRQCGYLVYGFDVENPKSRTLSLLKTSGQIASWQKWMQEAKAVIESQARKNPLFPSEKLSPAACDWRNTRIALVSQKEISKQLPCPPCLKSSTTSPQTLH